MYPCIDVCAFEGTNTCCSLYRMISAGEILLRSVPQASGITSRVAAMLSWSQFWGSCWVCSRVHVWQACYQRLGWARIFFGTWAYGPASRILLSRAVLGQMWLPPGPWVSRTCSGPWLRGFMHGCFLCPFCWCHSCCSFFFVEYCNQNRFKVMGRVNQWLYLNLCKLLQRVRTPAVFHLCSEQNSSRRFHLQKIKFKE